MPALAGVALIAEQIGGGGADAEPGCVRARGRTHGNNYSVCGSDSSSWAAALRRWRSVGVEARKRP